MLMNKAIQTINCGHPSHTYKNFLSLSFNNNDPSLQKAIAEGRQRAQKVNPRDPSGRIRSLPQLESTNIRGVLAEICTENILMDEIKKLGLNAQIGKSSDIIDDIEGITQVDLYLTIGDKKFEIETRSSCVRNGINFGITSRFFNIVGWYKTSSKPNEPKKDFYFMYLYGFDESETASRLATNLEVCFVGGATKSMLQGVLGSDETMKQTGALYRGINPICAALDSQQIIDEIFS